MVLKNFSLLFLLLSSANAFACEFNVTKTELAIGTDRPGMCLEDYFYTRDLGRNSLGEDERTNQAYLFRDPKNMRFFEMFLLKNNLPELLGQSGRIALVKKLYATYLNSLRNDFGQCKLEIKSKDKILSIEEFLVVERTVGGQPGTRLTITKDDVESPSWKLICPDASGALVTQKQGTYFFLFMEVYEDTNVAIMKDYLAQYLLSFH